MRKIKSQVYPMPYQIIREGEHPISHATLHENKIINFYYYFHVLVINSFSFNVVFTSIDSEINVLDLADLTSFEKNLYNLKVDNLDLDKDEHRDQVILILEELKSIFIIRALSKIDRLIYYFSSATNN